MHATRMSGTLLLAAALTTACTDQSAPADTAEVSSLVPPSEVNHEVDISRLVPLLSPAFTNWSCIATGKGPMCQGEWLIDTGWELTTEFPCAAPLYHHFIDFRRQTRYYDEDYLNYFRRFHLDQTEYFSLSPDGDNPVVIRGRINFTETYVVAGDDATRTIKSNGLLFQLKDTRGGVILQWSGAILEPPGGDLEVIGGNVNSVKSFLKDPDAFVAALCHALGTEVIS